jgi:Rrf2 family transcriptional regulator, iron-sulfur cluster assembly transcription factor
MRITALEEYGLRCLITLAKEGIEGQLSITDIAHKEGISSPYVSKVMARLRKTGFVNAVRGRSGGFCISRTPDRIVLLDVITALGGPLIDPNYCARHSGKHDSCVHIGGCSIQNMLGGLSGIINDTLSSLTLQDMLDNDKVSKRGLGNINNLVNAATTGQSLFNGNNKRI